VGGIVLDIQEGPIPGVLAHGVIIKVDFSVQRTIAHSGQDPHVDDNGQGQDRGETQIAMQIHQRHIELSLSPVNK